MEKIKFDIHYSLPKTRDRFFAALIDVFCVFLIVICLTTTGIPVYQNTSHYINNSEAVLHSQIDSGFYLNDENATRIDVYLEDEELSGSMSDEEKMNYLYEKVTNYFISVNNYEYFESLMNNKEINDNIFVYNDKLNVYELNYQEGKLPKEGYEVMTNIFVNYALPYFFEHNEAYRNGIFNIFYSYVGIFFISLFIGHLIIYLIIPLCFKNGKNTLGMKLFHISYIDNNGLMISFKKYILVYLFRLFVMCFLSIASILLPQIISSLMILIRSDKSNLTDYIFKIYKVDDGNSKIYKNVGEYLDQNKIEEVKNEKLFEKEINETKND